jgi:hypothetical protein
MSRTTEQNEKTGEYFPRKSPRKQKDKKFFGFHSGDVHYGYPQELRPKSVIKQKIMDDLTNEELKSLTFNK